jgi:hypothetical protein
MVQKQGAGKQKMLLKRRVAKVYSRFHTSQKNKIIEFNKMNSFQIARAVSLLSTFSAKLCVFSSSDS